MNIASKLAEDTLSLEFEALGPEVIHQAKRVLMDALGCCIGAVGADAVEIVRGFVMDQQCPGTSTVVGGTERTNSLNALLANGIMLRYLDYNDCSSVQAGAWYVGAHPSETIPAILAVGETLEASGRDVLTAIVLAYQLSMNFCQAMTDPPMSKLGWNIDTRGLFVVPLVIGRMLGLDKNQLENALGISGCQGVVLGILDTAAEEYAMAKSLRYARTAHGAVQSTFLARRGFTGPKSVIEGTEGFNQSVMNSRMDLDLLAQGFEQFHIMDTSFKNICSCATMHGHLEATMKLVRENDIRPEAVDRVEVVAGTRPIEHTGDPAKKYPVNKETADHSSYYLTALAVIDRRITPESYQPWKYKDPLVLDLIEKVTLEIDPAMDSKPRSGRSTIHTKDGGRYEARVDYPKGNPKSPMSDADLENKLTAMAQKHMPPERIEGLLDTIYHLEELEKIDSLMKFLRF